MPYKGDIEYSDNMKYKHTMPYKGNNTDINYVLAFGLGLGVAFRLNGLILAFLTAIT